MEELVERIQRLRHDVDKLWELSNKYMVENKLVPRDEDNLDFLVYHLEDIVDMLEVSLERIGRTS